MFFFSRSRTSPVYDKVLKAYGINSRRIPRDVSARICRYTEQQISRRAARWPDLGSRSARESQMSDSAKLVVFCMLGPKAMSKAGGDAKFLAEQVKWAASDWKNRGPESSLDALIIKTLRDAQLLNGDFAKIFNSMIQ